MVKWNGTPAGSDDWEPRPFTSPTADVAPPRFEGASEVPGDARAVVAVLVALAAIGLLVSWTRRR
ncbi:MAG: hypothetical protein HYT80_00980 [Euryarchaeota archaeon]|nr:hypothetical protein [Euryarchaeota archaeon]